MLDGDDRFLRVVLRGAPHLLDDGIVAGAINLRFRDGQPDPRGGCVKPAWLNQISGSAVLPWNSVQGRGSFVDAAQRSWTVLAVNGGIRACLPHNAPRTVPLPAGETLPSSVTFEQFRDAVYLFRGDDQDPLRMSDLGVGFELVPDPIAPGVSRIPRGKRGVTAGDRLWVMTGTDQVWASDALDPTSYDALHKFRFSDGIPDSLVTIAVFNETSLIGLKQKSIWRLSNIVGDLTDTQARKITSRYGCRAAESVVDLGSDLAWWCQEGVAKLSLTIQGEIQVASGGEWPPMFSDDIEPLVKRVRGDYAQNIQSELVDGRLYIAVPLDQAETLGQELLGQRPTSLVPNEFPVVAGKVYRFLAGSLVTSLVNGSETLTASGDFTAQGTEVTINATSGNLIGSSLKQLYRGINNAVLVYDFKALQPGWQGYDEAAGILFPTHWFRRDYNGNERLFFIAGDGWINLFEEGEEDALGQPYVDVLVSTPPQTGDTIRVNGGTVVTANAASASNGATAWGSALLPASALNGDSTAGYFHGSPTVWSAPDTRNVALPNTLGLAPSAFTGIRFYATNGRLPTVVTTGTWATVNSYAWQPIRTDFFSRGYATPVKLEKKTASKLQVLIETRHPTYSLALKSEGVNKAETFVTNRTRSRTVYDRPFHKQAWLATNLNNDFPTPDRQDYTMNLSTPIRLGDGLTLGLHQAAEHVAAVGGRSRAHQVRVTNTTGRLRITGIGYEGRRRERGNGVKL